jgi:hypothetical protein
MSNNNEDINILEVVLDKIDESKRHGAGNIVKTKNIIMKLIWFVCLLAISAGYFMYELVIAVMAYLQ